MKSSVQRAPLALAEHFAALEDPRVVGRSVYPLLTVLVMALVGVVCGAKGWDDLAEIGEDRRAWFERFLDLPHGVPSADTFRRVLAALDPATFATCVAGWITSLAAPLAGQVVAFDGKAIRGALARNAWARTLHRAHVWACEQRLLLAQADLAGAADEPAAVRAWLALVELKGTIATGDAAHCCAATAQAILDAAADYLLQLKAHRAVLHAAVAAFFDAARRDGFGAVRVRHARTEDDAHGRLEVREAWAVPAAALALPGVEWPALRSVACVERAHVRHGAIHRERHFDLTSLAPTVGRILAAVREHWQLENALHWVLDVQLGEDACAIGEARGARNFATLRRIVRLLLSRETTLKRGIAAKRARAARNTDYLERVLAGAITGV